MDTPIPTIDVATLRLWLEQGRPVHVLDVRSSADRAEWAIPGSTHVDAYAALKAGDPYALDTVALPIGVPIITVCGAGAMSLVAAEQLRLRGASVFSLEGGMRAWSLAWNVAPVSLPGSSARVIQVRRTGKGCLSYLIGSEGSAAVIDPALEPGVYVGLAQQHGLTIRAVLDTHIHADHLSRARALAAATGATLYLPRQERVAFANQPLNDGAQIAVGGAQLVALRTPGHTSESTCYMLDGVALFTGDTLFLSAVGRPDLHADAGEARARTRQLYASLQRLLALPPTTLVLPGHTSAPAPFDGQPIAAPLATIREQTALLQADEEAFVATTLARVPPKPPNYEQIVALNEAGTLADDAATLEAGANRCAIA